MRKIVLYGGLAQKPAQLEQMDDDDDKPFSSEDHSTLPQEHSHV